MPEVAAAMAVFIFISAIISASVAKSLTVQGSIKNVRAATSEVTSYLNQISTNSFESLNEGSMVIPGDSCGTANSPATCFNLGPAPLEIKWDIIKGTDSLQETYTAISDLNIRATTTLPDGTVISKEKVVKAPVSGWKENTGILKVQNVSNYQGPLFLINNENKIVASANSENQSFTFRGVAAECTAELACRLSLNELGATETPYNIMSANDAANNNFVLIENNVINASVNITPAPLTAPVVSEIEVSYNDESKIISLKTTDVNNNPVGNVTLSLNVESGANQKVMGVYPQLKGCTTNADGVCEMPLVVELEIFEAFVKLTATDGLITNSTDVMKVSAS